MMSAFFSAVSGLKSETYNLDVIANNIANVNTTGYKADSVSFSDLLSQTISGATSSSSTTGGTNAKQIGLGVSVASTNINMSVGSTESTGVATDISIGGDGFLIVSGGSTGQYQFTRDGDLSIDANGNLTVNGNKVNGWEYYTTDSSGTSTYDTSRNVEAINLYSDSYNGNKKEMAAKASTENTLSGNIYANNTASGTAMENIGTTPTSYDSSQTVKEYDSDGNSHQVTINYKKCYSEGGYTTYYWTASAADSSADTVGGTSSGYICFDSSGNIVTGPITTTTPTVSSVTATTGSYTASNVSTSGDLTAGTYNVAVTESGGTYTITMTDSSGNTVATGTTTSSTGAVTLTTSSGGTVTLTAPTAGYASGDAFSMTVASTTNSYDFTGSATPTITVTPTDSGLSAFNVKLDFSGITQTTSTDTSDTLTYTGDGYEAGSLQSIAIGSDGVITGTYSNGKTKPLAEIALATFTNPQGLEKIGDNLYATTNNSGDFTGGVVAGTAGTGSLSSGTLEMSNVDLANELSQMMIAQRAYQANTKAISTADEMLQSLIAMKS